MLLLTFDLTMRSKKFKDEFIGNLANYINSLKSPEVIIKQLINGSFYLIEFLETNDIEIQGELERIKEHVSLWNFVELDCDLPVTEAFLEKLNYVLEDPNLLLNKKRYVLITN